MTFQEPFERRAGNKMAARTSIAKRFYLPRCPLPRWQCQVVAKLCFVKSELLKQQQPTEQQQQRQRQGKYVEAGGEGGEGAASATVSFIVDIAAKKGSKGNKKQLTWLTSLLKVETHGAIYAAGVGAPLVLPSTAADAGEQVQRVGVPSVQRLSRCVQGKT